MHGTEARPRSSVDNDEHPSPSHPDEMAATGETSEKLPDASAFLDALATAPEEPSIRTEVESFPWMDDVLGQIAELEAAQSSETPSQYEPPFLNILDELPPPTVEPDPPTSAAAVPSFLEVHDAPQEVANAPQAITPSHVTNDVPRPSGGKWRIWLAAAAVLVFAILGTIQWRMQRDRSTKAAAEVNQEKTPSLAPANPANANSDQSGAGSRDASASSPAIPPQAQDQSAAIKVSAPASPVSWPDKALPSGQGPGGAPPAENAGSAKAPVPRPAAQAPAPALEKPKATETPARGKDQEVQAHKIVPGTLEMTKAKNASDAAAQAAWLWKATAKGNPDAPVQLADMYIKGDGVPRSCEQALVLLKTAAIKDNARACNRLASMYAAGTCVQRNQVEAYRWLSSALAADPNSQWAQQNRDLTWKQMTPEERAQIQKHP